jgi:SAM-dependent methyltransferase
MRQAIKDWLASEAFLTTPLGVLVNPFHILRRGLHKTIAKIAPRIGGDVLDFGCGSKPYESLFVEADSYTGVDIEVSGHNHQAQRSRVDVFYDGQTLPFAEHRFDAVVSFETLEHVFNLDTVLGEIRRVLKHEGMFLASLPFAWDEHEAPYDFARYTSYGICQVLERSGFEVIEIHKTTTYVQAVFQIGIAYLFQYTLPRGRLTFWVSQLVVIFPLTLASMVFDAVLPRRQEYFCNLVVLARRKIAI